MELSGRRHFGRGRYGLIAVAFTFEELTFAPPLPLGTEGYCTPERQPFRRFFSFDAGA